MAPPAVTGVIYALFLMARLHCHGFDPSYFVVAGSDHFDAPSADPTLRSIRDGPGYDGQYYYRLAVEPFSTKVTDHGIRFNMPAYRQQRIMYPLLAWILSAGNPAFVPVALIALNYLGLCTISWLGGILAHAAMRRRLWGIVFSLYPGFVFTLSRDLTEIVASSFLLAGLVLMHRHRHGFATMCFSLAVLSRETAILVPIVTSLVFAMNSKKSGGNRRWFLYAIPTLIYVVWRSYVHFMWAGFPDMRLFGGVLVWPFSGVGWLWSTALRTATLSSMIWCAETVLIGLMVVRALQVWHLATGLEVEGTSLFLYTGMVLCLSKAVWVEDQAFLRATTEIFLLATICLLRDRKRMTYWIYVMWVAATCFTVGWRVEW